MIRGDTTIKSSFSWVVCFFLVKKKPKSGM